MRTRRTASTWHLVRRFAGSLRPGGPGAGEEAWVASVLRPGELVLWRSMSGPDRRHAAGVARDVETRLGGRATAPVLAAALLHDVGKVEAGLRTPARVVATVLGALGARAAGPRWSRGGGVAGRIDRYLRHDELGAASLEAAGSDPLTVAWAREHHRPRTRWTVPLELADVLKAADDD